MNNEHEIYKWEMGYELIKYENNKIKIQKAPQSEKRMTYFAHSADFDLIAPILEEATFINHITGEPILVNTIFYREVFTKIIKRIHFYNNELPSIIIDDNFDISTIDYNLVKMIVKHWRENNLWF